MSEKGKDPRVPLDSSRIWLILIILLGSAVRLYRLDYQSLWFDESLSMALASAPLKLSIEATLAEGLQHLPLYYLLLRIFVWIGRSEMVLRLPSAVCGVLAFPLIYQVGRRCLGQGTGCSRPFCWLSIPTTCGSLRKHVCTACLCSQLWARSTFSSAS